MIEKEVSILKMEFFEDLNFIERHSKQLVLSGWSMELQSYISSLIISVPANPLLLSYLIALGVNKFHLQNDTKNSVHEEVTNIEKQTTLNCPAQDAKIAFINDWDHMILDKNETIIEMKQSADSNLISFTNKRHSIYKEYSYKKIDNDKTYNQLYTAACSVFAHEIKANYKLFLNPKSSG